MRSGTDGCRRGRFGHLDVRVVRRGDRVSAVPVAPPRRLLDVEVDGRPVRVSEGSTILDACRAEGIETPTMCYADNLTPVNACRVCVVEVEGARTLVPACSRPVEAGRWTRTSRTVTCASKADSGSSTCSGGRRTAPEVAPVSAIAGIVLAGGGSIRFGSDKLLAPYHGSSLLNRAIERVGEVSDDVIVVMSPAAADPAMPPRAKVVRDASEGEGPLAGLHAGLLAA
ncbi:MAG: 2Fe-2S iron-sulfur cluster binding domain-containing protein, partial [Actinobacteria bacterium]